MDHLHQFSLPYYNTLYKNFKSDHLNSVEAWYAIVLPMRYLLRKVIKFKSFRGDIVLSI